MVKIANDKYYTPQSIVDLVIQRTKEIIGLENITEFIEPSAGNGAFLYALYATEIPTKAYDLYPERDDIVEQDYLELEMEYKKGRCVIGNPPFGSRNTLSVKFYKKSIQLGDYVVFILPISQFENNMQMYEFDMVYSEDLDKKEYSDRIIHCCMNIYKRNDNGYNKKPNYKLKDVEVLEYRRGGKYEIPTKYDYAMCAYGSLGKELDYPNQYCQENYIIVKNKIYECEILKIMKNTNWKELYPYVGSPKIQTWKIYKYLKEQIPELE